MKRLYFVLFFILIYCVADHYCYAKQVNYVTWCNEKIFPIDNATLPDISPDGKKMVFLKRNTKLNELYVSNIDGTNIKILLSDRLGDYISPKWSPDGQKIVYLKNSGFQMWIINADGSNNKPITPDKYELMNPTWWPSGKKIVYFRGIRFSYDEGEDRGGVGLRVLTLENNTDIPLGGLELSGPVAFSNDGRTLVLLQDQELICLNLDGTIKEKKQIHTPLSKGVETIVWTPDGRYIVLNNLLYICATGEEVQFLPDSLVKFSEEGKPDLDGPNAITLSNDGKKIAFVMKYRSKGVYRSKIKTMDIIWK